MIAHSDQCNEKEGKLGQILRNFGEKETNEMTGMWFSLLFLSLWKI